MNRRLVLAGAFLLVMAAVIVPAFAAEDIISDLTITIDGQVVTDSGVWIREYSGQSTYEKNSGPVLHAVSTCRSANGTSGDLALTLYPIGSAYLRRTFTGDATTDFTLKNLWGYGRYTIEASCSVGNQTSAISKSFSVHKMEFFFQNSDTIEAEIGFEAKVPLIYRLDGNIIADKNNITIRLRDASHTYLSSVPDYLESIGGDYVEISVAVPYDVPEGKRTLDVITNYEGYSVNISRSIEILSPIDVEIETESVSCRANEYCPFEISVLVTTNGPKSVSEYATGNFLVGIYRASDGALSDYPSITRVDCNENTKRCILKLMTDEKVTPGDYTLKVSVVDNQLGSAPKFLPLSCSYFLQGTIRNAENSAVRAKMTFINKDTKRVVTKEFSGDYVIEILRGTYDISMDLQGGALIAEVTNASFENALLESTKNINFDSFEQADLLAGVHTVRVVVLELGFDFETMNLKIPYNNVNVYNEENLEVYRCLNWNFGTRKCNGNWTVVEGTVLNSVADIVELDTERASALLLGEKKFLHFNTVGSATKETGLGGVVPIEGQILDSDGKEISGVNITLKADGYQTTVGTVNDGSFLGYVTLPYKEGLFDVQVIAEKSPYVGCSDKVVLKTVKKEGLAMVLPEDQISLALDEPRTVEISVVNDGQVEITNIYLRLDGISTKTYALVPDNINRLSPGETKVLKLNLNMSSEECGEKCLQYTSVGVEARGQSESGQEVSVSGTFIIELQKSLGIASQENSGLSGLSGMFSFPAVSNTMLLNGVIVLCIVIVAILIIKKKRGSPSGGIRGPYQQPLGGGAPRTSVVSSIKTIRNEIKNKK
ncbi:MAG: hypothetical protein JW727_00110 [Candidatus Aenigmarchaeota archaeon]|nr:hypothetical protein [Candidatus Aenigmarchaeota archaeon]